MMTHLRPYNLYDTADALEQSARRVFVAWFILLTIIGSLLAGLLAIHGIIYVLDTIGFIASLISFFFIRLVTYRIIDAIRMLSKAMS